MSRMLYAAIFALALVASALALLAAPLCVGWAYDEDGLAAERHAEKAAELRRDQRWAEAKREYEAARALRPDVYQLLGIARCVDELGDYDLALETYDRAIAEGGNWYQPYHDKAACIERNRGVEAAVQWYEKLEGERGEVAKYRYLIGSLHMDHGRPARAIPSFERALHAVMTRHGLHFDDANELRPLGRVVAMGQNDLADLWPEVSYIADCNLRIEKHEEAYRWATRGISLHRHLNRSKGYCSPEEIAAGDTRCRLIRARVHMHRGQ